MPVAGMGEPDDSELRDLTRRLWIGVALSIPLVALAMAPMIGIHEPFGLQPRRRRRRETRRPAGLLRAAGCASRHALLS